MRLFLFPYAGGGPAVFGAWPGGVSPAIEVWIAHYPGRGSRHTEAPSRRIPALAEKLTHAIRPFTEKPFALFGHSLGGLVAFEIARNLQRRNQPEPKILFVSGCGAPHLPDPEPPIHALPDDEFLRSVQQINGLPAEIMEQPEAIQMYLPVLRADFEAVERYLFAPRQGLLRCPVVAFGGRDDRRVNPDRLEGWARHTVAEFRSKFFPGDHFFIKTSAEPLMATISAELILTHAGS